MFLLYKISNEVNRKLMSMFLGDFCGFPKRKNFTKRKQFPLLYGFNNAFMLTKDYF